jgi:HEXXH motif-containing protein
MPSDEADSIGDFPRHRMSWADLDAMAAGGGGARVVGQLRRVERSRRLLLLRSLVDEGAKFPELTAALSPAEDAWELLARTEQAAPAVLDLVLAHPYTGSWAGYTTRLRRQQISGVWPFWVHFGYVHALAAAAAIRAGIRFEISVPVWQGDVILPTLGLVRLPVTESPTAARIIGEPGSVEIHCGSTTVRLPADLGVDTPVWWSIRRVVTRANGRTFAVFLDDVDPYRGAYEPLGPQRLSESEVSAWQDLMAEAWALIAHGLPDFADALREGFDSVVPEPLTLFRAPSASSGDAFGSAILGRPADAASLAAMLVHEFQHSRLSGLTHMARLWEDDPRERFYAPWRDDPRPVGGLFQGLYAFFGMTAFWRALASHQDRRGSFEFAYHRAVTWNAVNSLRHDAALTGTGHRFIAAIAEVLGPWQDEPVAADLTETARRAALDHYLGWRIRHVRPDPVLVSDLTNAWLDAWTPKRLWLGGERPPSPVPDGKWTHARADLIRLVLTPGPASSRPSWKTVPDVTPADFALVSGRFTDAARGYRAELADDPDRPTSLAGLTLALSASSTSPATRVLLHYPELVRAVQRRVRRHGAQAPSAEELADWIGRTAL